MKLQILQLLEEVPDVYIPQDPKPTVNPGLIPL